MSHISIKRSLQANIKFIKKLIIHLNSDDKEMQRFATYTAICLNEYINKQLKEDVKSAVGGKKELK
jgi:hypothetical protein